MDNGIETKIETPNDESIRELIRQKNVVIFTCTYYPNVSDLRLNQCLKTLRCIHGASSIPVVVVDGSPPDVHELIKTSTGAIVRKEQKTYGNGKGGALREAAAVAASLPGVNETTLLCWQEAEKSDMMRCWQEEVFGNCDANDDVICPGRDDECFKSSYPIEQYHSEMYGNYYLNCVMKNELEGTEQSCGDIDWHFGPFAFRKKLLNLWLEYKGTSYDAQLIPIVAAIRKGGLMINTQITVSFKLEKEMKAQEEGNVDFIEKRIQQLNGLDPKVKQFWKDPLYC